MAREILKDAAIVGFSGIIASVFSYGFLMMLGNFLSPFEFGDMAIVLSVMLVVSIVLTVLNSIVIQYISYFRAKSQRDKIVTFSKRSLMMLAILGAIICGVVQYFAADITFILNVHDEMIIRLMGVLLLLELCGQGSGGVLSGLSRFGALGIARIVQSIVNLIAGFTLIYLGFGAVGAIAGLIIGNIVFIPLSFFLIRRDLFAKGERIGRVGIFSYLGLATPISLALGIIFTVDVFLAKYFLLPEEAGLYAAASVFGSVSFFVMSSVTRVMFGKVANFQSDGKDSLPLLKEGFVYTGVLTGAMTIACIFFPEQVSRILFSADYDIAQLIQFYVPAMFCLAMTSVLILYKVACKKYSILAPCVLCAAFKVWLLSTFHTTALEMAQMLLFFHVIFMLALFLAYRDTIIEALKKTKGYFQYTDILEYPGMKN